MKTLQLTVLVIFAAVSIQAAPILTITNYFPGYVCVTNGWSTATESGLASGAAYIAIPLSVLTNATEANCAATNTTSDIRVLIYAINDRHYESFTAIASSNRPSSSVIVRSTSSSGAAQKQTQHMLVTKYTYTGEALTTE